MGVGGKRNATLTQGDVMALPKMVDDLFIGQCYSGIFGSCGEGPLYMVLWFPRHAPTDGPPGWIIHKVIAPESPEVGSNECMLADDECYLINKDNIRWMVDVRIDYILIIEKDNRQIICWTVEDITRHDSDSLSNLMPVIKGQRPHLDEVIRAGVIDFLNTRMQPGEQPLPEHQPELGGSD